MCEYAGPTTRLITQITNGTQPAFPIKTEYQKSSVAELNFTRIIARVIGESTGLWGRNNADVTGALQMSCPLCVHKINNAMYHVRYVGVPGA